MSKQEEDNVSGRGIKRWVALAIVLVSIGLTACGTTPVTAQERTFLNLSLEFLDRYELPTFNDTPLRGLSALTYDRQQNRFYVLSDDRSQFAPARFFTLNVKLAQAETVKIDDVTVESVTFLSDEQGEFPKGQIDPEGIALSPRGTIFISSEGVPSENVAPFIGEFERQSGQIRQSLKIPERYLPHQTEAGPIGVQKNLGFESLTLSPSGLAADDPFRLFTAVESALYQDSPSDPADHDRVRLLHYVIGPVGPPVLVAEHLYLLDSPPEGAIAYGLTELITLDKEGYFLSLERSYSSSGWGAKIFEVVIGNATDTFRIASLSRLGQVVPLKKKLLLDLSELGIDLDNLEGMSLGPHLSDGSQSLVLVSDDNFKDNQVTQLLLFRLKNGI